jgi:hypothetical protein
MTQEQAKEKAKELVGKYSFVYIQNYTSMFEVKQCALIAVDEIINECIRQSFINHGVDSVDYGQSFWQEVKQEIEKL